MMGPSEIWVSLTTTDRPASLRRLAADLVEQSEEIGCRLCLFVIDNGRGATARQATEDALSAFPSTRRSLRVEQAETLGGSIAASRRCQREQVRRALAPAQQPEFLWMLDDDLRLEHYIREDGRLVTRRLHNHLGFLLEVKREYPELEVLLGEVNGDPPIPPIATYASRLEDFAGSLRSVAILEPGERWPVGCQVEVACSDDSYYDFAEPSAHVTASSLRSWIPADDRVLVVDVLSGMVAEACDIPFGIGFSRPILARGHTFDRMRDDTIRGGHAVFFSSDAFLSQRYPSLTMGGIETRRSDTLASTLFASTGPRRLRRSGFSVRHARPRDEHELPFADDIARNLISDTWGAALTRAVTDEGATVSSFLNARAERIDSVLDRTRSAIDQVRELAGTMPSWATERGGSWEQLDERLTWMLETVPGLRQGRLPARWRDVLIRPEHSQALVDFAHRLRQNAHAE